MKLSPEDVEHVAMLARLGLTDEEKRSLQEQLSSILEHVTVLEELDTDAIPPTAQVGDLENVMRDDVVRPSLSQDAVLANAPRHVEGYVEVHTPLAGEEEPA